MEMDSASHSPEDDSTYEWMVGEVFRTPFEPSGLVEVLLVEEGDYFGKKTVWVRFVEDHPHGYPKDSCGRYIAKELRPLE